MSALPGTTGRRRIYLMRHGHVDYFAPELVETSDPTRARLTEQGKEQASSAGQALSAIPFDIALCSGLLRTRETAELVLDWQAGRDLTLEEDRGLEELRSGQFIAFESREQLAATMTFYFENAPKEGAAFFEGGELFADAQLRAQAAIMRLIQRPGWSNALVVAHEGINRLLLSWFCNAGLDATVSFEQDTGCINILDVDLIQDGDTSKIERKLIKAVNQTPLNYEKNGMNLRSVEAIFDRR